MTSLTFPNSNNKGNYSKNINGSVFFNGWVIKDKNMRELTINELITYKSLLINL